MSSFTSLKWIRAIINLALFLALVVVMLGAYTRLTDAGLGCPDWPGCYGHMVLPDAPKARQSAQAYYPQIPIDSRKAWTEMNHRYAAGTLMLLILIISASMFKQRKNPDLNKVWPLSFALILLATFQALLGMWTVTLKLLPVVVMGHLLGGILIFSCLSRLRFQLSDAVYPSMPQWRWAIGLGIAIVFCQIALGGWVSANYAGIACIGFPQCNGQWIPTLHFNQGFNFFSFVGENYQGGLLENEVRVSIQWIHRIGACITAVYLLVLSAFLWKDRSSSKLRYLALLIASLILFQFILGIFNVIYFLPISIAVLHNGVAAALMATLFTAFSLVQGKSRKLANVC